MTVTVDAKAFHAALQGALGAVRPAKGSVVLGFVRLSASDDALRLEATDLDVRIVHTLAAQGDMPDTLIEGSRLLAVLAKLRDRGDVRLEPERTVAILNAGRSRFTLPTLGADAWPQLAPVQLPTEFEVEGPVFGRLMTALAPAISTEQTRYYLCGVYLQPGRIRDAKKKDCLIGVATDGHKAYARHIEVTGLPAGMKPIIVPAFTCSAFAKIFGDAERVTVRCSEDKIEFSTDDVELRSKLVEGQFPDWRRVIPMNDPELSYDAALLSVATSTVVASRTADKSGKAVKLTFGDAETELSTEDRNTAASGTDVCAHSVLIKPKRTEIGVNGDYLAEMIDVLDADTVQLSLPEGDGPIILTGATHDDRIIAVMPMRV